MEKNRLEAFSDGVLAIIITIMVLELKAPHGADWQNLKPLIPIFISYVISFLYVGIYWGNHHHLFQIVENVSSGMLLANLNLLFWLSLLPFATGWMGVNNFASVTVTFYAILLTLCAIAYFILQNIIIQCHEKRCSQVNPAMVLAMQKQKKKGYISLAIYTTSILVSLILPGVAGLLLFLVAVIWLIPDKNIERAFYE
jgi:uncharacterized membrane protein